MADELEPHEIGEAIHGGGRFNHWLLIVGVIVAMIVGVVLVHGLVGSGTVSQTATKQLDDEDAARDKARVKELASYASPPGSTVPQFHFPQVLMPMQPAARATPKPERQLSPYEQWAREEFLSAHMAPPLVKEFHDHSTLEMAQAGGGGNTVS